MTFTLLKYFEDRTQTDSFDSLSISATLNSTKIAFQFFIKHSETGEQFPVRKFTPMNVKLN